MEILEQLKGPNGKKISGYIERGVRLLHEQATLAEDLKALAEDVKTEFDIKTAEFTKVAKAAYDTEMLAKKQEELEQVAKAAYDTEMLAKKQEELEQVAQAVDVHQTLS